MADRSQRKAQKRQKREQKRAESRRAQSASPYKRIGQTGELSACYINTGWETGGMVQIQIIRECAGGYALAAFLVDIWCLGLKDAFGFIHMSQQDLDDMRQQAIQRSHVEFVRVDFALASGLITGGIRFARQNGFRLPDHFERWLSLAGINPDVSNANLERFGKGGKLRWIGSNAQLAQRLVHQSVEDFLARPDVEFAMVDPDEIDETPLTPQETRGYVQDDIATEWNKAPAALKELGESPHPHLETAYRLVQVSNAILEEEDPEAGFFDLGELKILQTELESKLDSECPFPDEFDRALEQAYRIRDVIIANKGVGGPDPFN